MRDSATDELFKVQLPAFMAWYIAELEQEIEAGKHHIIIIIVSPKKIMKDNCFWNFKIA